MNERLGIVYDKLEGDTLLDLLLGGTDVAQMMLKFANVHKAVLSQHVENVLSYKEFLRCCVSNGRNKEVLNQIQSLPEGNCLCHGDFHPGNVWVSSNGEWFVIDFMNVCCGPWQYDVARSYLLIAEGNIPENIPNRDDIRSMQQQLAQQYLQYIEVTLDELEEYITVIRIARTYEK